MTRDEQPTTGSDGAAVELDRRTYDLLRLIEVNEPIGSIRLVEQMRRRGYSIKDRTIRLLLSELDEAGLTAKVSGKGRRLTDAGRAELRRGDVSGRLERVRERIATLTSRVTYDPADGAGELVVGAGRVVPGEEATAFDLLERLHDSGVGPVLAAPGGAGDSERGRTDGLWLSFPSSITLDGVLLSRGLDARLITAGLVEYDGGVRRYIDAINGEGATMDVVRLLIEAGRTDVEAYVSGDTGVLVVDNREFPLTRFEEARDLSESVREDLGGVLDLRRPRESGPFPAGTPGWEFASLTYGGAGETVLALLHEHDLLADWATLDGLRSRAAFEPVAALRDAMPR